MEPKEVVADAYAFAVPPGAAPDRLTKIASCTGELADGSFANLDVARLPLPAYGEMRCRAGPARSSFQL